jgi:hypothetical protein
VDVSTENKQCLRDRFPEGKFHVEGCTCYSLEPLLKARDANCHDQTHKSGYLTSRKEQTNLTELFEFQLVNVVSMRLTKFHVTIAQSIVNTVLKRQLYSAL